MSTPKSSASPVVVLGDLIGSRRVADRAHLHDRLTHALEDANQRWGTELRVSVGDEYQGTVPSLGVATSVALGVRLALLPAHDVRHGIARGATVVVDAATGIQDGPGWWGARDAIDAAEERAGRAATRSSRTTYVATDPAEDPRAVNAALLARDELVGRLDERSLSVLRGLIAGRTQREIAAELGVSASAVSQRVRHDALGVVLTMTEWMEELA